MDVKSTLFVVNPTAKAGAGRRQWEAIHSLITQDSELSCDLCVRFTEGARHAIQLAKQACFEKNDGTQTENVISDSVQRVTRSSARRKDRRFSTVCAVGGDGTLNEVVNGLMQVDAAQRCALAYIPCASGGDFNRTLKRPTNARQIVSSMKSWSRTKIDVGSCQCMEENSSESIQRYFINIGSLGVSGATVEHTLWTKRKIPITWIQFYLAAAMGLLTWKNVPVRYRKVASDSGEGCTADADVSEWKIVPKLTDISFANGRFYGGGMLICPDADLFDGGMDVNVWDGLKLWHFIWYQSYVYDGRHTQLPNTTTFRTRDAVEVESVTDAKILVELDGEAVGLLPAKFALLPSALDFWV